MSRPPRSEDAPGNAAILEDVRQTLRQAFPLPSSGRFDDLLERLSSGEDGKAAECS
jgi:hypothetical protein